MKNLLILLAAVMLAFPAQAHSFKSGDIDIGHPWAKPTAQGATSAEVYMGLMNMGDKPDTLQSASTSIAHKAELNDGGGTVQSIELPPKKGVPMRPAGAHIALSDLKGPLVEGDKFTVRLTFTNAPPVDVMVFVQEKPTESSMSPHMHQ